ncbi:Uncharacterized protein K02A2.6, partial [Araneus ventricosus]
PKQSLPVLRATRLLHYAIFLSGFDYDIKYQETKKHGNADALSRLPLKVTSDVVADIADVIEIGEIETMPVTAKDLGVYSGTPGCFIRSGLGKTIEILRSLFCRYDLPKTLVSDNGRSFISNEFQTFLKNNGIYHIKTSPYFPNSNGQAERFVRTFKDAMRQAKIDFGSRDYKLQKFLLQYRKTPHSTTHQSPAMMFLGRDIRTRLNLLRPNETPYEKATDSPVRQFDVGDKVAILDFSNTDGKWLFGTVLRKGQFNYQVEIVKKIHRRHIDQMRSVGSNIPLSSPELELSFPSIPEVSPTPSTSEKELPPVYTALTDEIESTPRPAEPTPTAMIPEQRSESSTVHPKYSRKCAY